MINLTSEERFDIKGRGIVYVIKLTDLKKGEKIGVGDHVKINGKEWKINGIEFFNHLMYPPKQGNIAGLVVKEP